MPPGFEADVEHGTGIYGRCMMDTLTAVRGLIFAVVSFAALAFSQAMAEEGAPEEGTVEAFSSWEADGEIYPTGVNEATFVGVLSGVLYVRAEDGSIDSGLLTCPATVVINTDDFSQTGKGKCIIITPEAERIYASFECAGEYGQGCNGDFALNGGTGEQENISGGGPIEFKSAFASFALTPGHVLEQSSVGLMLLPELAYKLP